MLRLLWRLALRLLALRKLLMLRLQRLLALRKLLMLRLQRLLALRKLLMLRLQRLLLTNLSEDYTKNRAGIPARFCSFFIISVISSIYCSESVSPHDPWSNHSCRSAQIKAQTDNRHLSMS